MFAMFSTHALHEWVCTYVRDDLCSNQQYRMPACIVWLYYACSYTVGPDKSMRNLAPQFEDILDNFFLLSVVLT